MRNSVVLGILLVVGQSAVAQNAYQKGNQVVHAGIGFGLAGLYGASTLPPLTLGYENGFDEKISLGGIVGFSGSKQTFPGGEWSYSYIIIAGRGGYHFLDNNDKLDAYGGIMVGYNLVSSSSSSTTPGLGFTTSASGSYILFGIYGGARYYVSPKFAVFGELGYGLGFLNIGIAYKL